MYDVAFNTSDLTRSLKLSAALIHDIAETRVIRPLEKIYEKVVEELEKENILDIIQEWVSGFYPLF